MNENSDFNELDREFNLLSENLKNVLDSLKKKIKSFDKNSLNTSEIIELIESYKDKTEACTLALVHVLLDSIFIGLPSLVFTNIDA